MLRDRSLNRITYFQQFTRPATSNKAILHLRDPLTFFQLRRLRSSAIHLMINARTICGVCYYAAAFAVGRLKSMCREAYPQLPFGESFLREIGNKHFEIARQAGRSETTRTATTSPIHSTCLPRKITTGSLRSQTDGLEGECVF
jgi:hypothetical protein